MFHPKANSDHMFDHGVVIRRATPADRDAIADLAALDSAPPLTGDALVAVVDGSAWAALSLNDGRVVADPFRPSAHAAELLRVRADHVRGGATARSIRRRALRPRRAAA